MCILLKLDYAKFGVSNLFFSKVMEVSIWPVTIPPPRADCRATNFFRQNPRPGDSFSMQNSGPRVGKMKQNPHPRA